MNLIYTLLLAFPLGFFVRSRSTAILSYLLAGSYLFSFQNTSVTLDWLGHVKPSAFGAFPEGFPARAENAELFGYAAVNVVITVVGIGLVILGSMLQLRRAAKRDVIAVG